MIVVGCVIENRMDIKSNWSVLCLNGTVSGGRNVTSVIKVLCIQKIRSDPRKLIRVLMYSLQGR